jgi:hypothetical protein
MPDSILAALITGALGFAAGWWLNRRRWQPTQHEVLSRFMTAADRAIAGLDTGDDPVAALLAVETVLAEVEMIVPARLYSRARRLRQDIVLADAAATVKNSRRDSHAGDDAILAADHKLRTSLEEARKERIQLLIEMRRQFGVGLPL